jgi:hypothetical protein
MRVKPNSLLTEQMQITASAAMHRMMRRPIWLTPEPHNSNATPSGSFSSNQRFRCVDIRKHLDVVGVADLLARIYVNEHGHPTIL